MGAIFCTPLLFICRQYLGALLCIHINGDNSLRLFYSSSRGLLAICASLQLMGDGGNFLHTYALYLVLGAFFLNRHICCFGETSSHLGPLLLSNGNYSFGLLYSSSIRGLQAICSSLQIMGERGIFCTPLIFMLVWEGFS